jgi:RHS repeat-associated protein
MQPSSGVDDQALSLPKGGGAVQSVGTTFDVDLNTGGGGFSIPLELPMGPNGIRPELTLRYAAGAGDGIFGMGWTLGLLAIARRTDLAIPSYGTDDSFALVGSENLVATGPTTFRPVVDTMHWLIEQETDGWTLTDTTDQVHRLGSTSASRVSSSESGTERIGQWLLDTMTDAFGNITTFDWLADGNQRYLSSISWGTYRLDFVYEARPDRLLDGRFGFLVATDKRCTQIALSVTNIPAPLVKSWDLVYDDAGGKGRSHLVSVTVTGHAADASTLSSPTTTFTYAKSGAPTLTAFSGSQPPPFSSGVVELVDWDGDGLPDVLQLAAGQAWLWPNRGNCQFGSPSPVPSLPAPFRYDTHSVAFADVTGSGTADLVVASTLLSGYYPLEAGGGFGQPHLWRDTAPAALASAGTRLVDLDGTGHTSLIAPDARSMMRWQIDDDGDWLATPSLLDRPGEPILDLRDAHVSFADMTGDGIQDLVRVDGTGVTYFPGLGDGRWGAEVRMTPSPVLPQHYDPNRMFLVDIDGDGCADLVYVDGGQVVVWFTVGSDSLREPQTIASLPTVLPGQLRVADMGGTGTAGLLFTMGSAGRGNRPSWYFLDLTGGVKPHLLTTIDNGVGLTTQVEYRSSSYFSELDRVAGHPWNTFHPFAMQCVAQVTNTDATTGVVGATSYRYHDGRYDPETRAFLGFSQVDSDVIGDAISTTTRTVTVFHVGLDPADPTRHLTGDEKLKLGALRRRVLSTTIYGIDGSADEEKPYSVVKHSFGCRLDAALDGKSVVMPYPVQTVEETWERGDAPFATRTIDYLTSDDDGNITSQRNVVVRAGIATPDMDVTTTATFASGGTNLRGCAARVTQTAGDGAILSESVTFYDGPDFVGLPEGQIDTGAIIRIEDLVMTEEQAQAVYGADQPDWAALSFHHLDGDTGWWATRRATGRSGGPGSTTLTGRSPTGGESVTVTDDTGQYVRTITDARGNTLTALEDLRVYQTEQVTDPNGKVTQDVFDALGRVIASIGPDASAAKPTEIFEYSVDQLPMRTGSSSRILAGKADMISNHQYVDGFGRTICQLSPGEGDAGRVWIVNSAVQFSSKGEVAASALPFYTDDPAWRPVPATVVTVTQKYDALGRITYQRSPGVNEVSWEFSAGSKTVTRAPDGGVGVATEKHTLDGLGRLIELARFDSARWVSIYYAYDDAGHLVETHNPDGAVTSMVYDLRGRLVSETSTDTGTLVNVLDAAANQLERRLPTGQSVKTEVDALGRVTNIRDSASPDAVVSYDYLDAGDAPGGAQNCIGRLRKVTDQLGELTFDYDALGRVINASRTVAVGSKDTYVTSTTFDMLGRPLKLTLPAVATAAVRKEIDYGYDKRGLLATASDLVTSTERDVFGRITNLVYDNGTKNLAEFDPVTGRMHRQQVIASDGSTLRDETFAFDDRGNLASATSPFGIDQVTFGYDGLNRLTAADYGDGTSFQYAYSDGGNITSVKELGAIGYAATTGSGQVVAANGDAYSYDAAGRLKAAPYGTLAFDALDNLRSVALTAGGSVDYTYDYRGQRVMTAQSGATVALSVTNELEFQGTTAILWLPFGAARVAALSQGKRLFVHPDLSGTPTIYTGDAGLSVRRLAFGPYGTLRYDSSPDALSPNPTGLTCLGRRWFDPRLGRFISPDPIVSSVFTLDAWNVYVYAHNNPISFTDPTGCSFWDVLAIIGIALIVVVLIVASYFTGGATLVVAGLVLQWSGILFATAIGIAGGAIIGGISAARAGGSIAGGVLLGGLLGGVGAFAGGVAGAAVAGSLFTAGSWGAFITMGLVQGAISGALTGVAAGFAGGKGSAEQILLAMAKGAAWGALIGAALGAATKVLFPTSMAGAAGAQPTNTYVGVTAAKWDPSGVASDGILSMNGVNYVDQYASAGFDYASEAADIARGGLGGFNGNGITEFVSTGSIQGASGTFEATASGSFSSGFNIGGVIIGRDGFLIAIPIGWVPQAVVSGAITSAVNFSMVLDYSGAMSYADQLVLLLNMAPLLDLALSAFEEFKYGWWEDGKQDFSAVFSSNPNPAPPPPPHP